MTGILFTFPTGNIHAEYITDSLTFTENYYNKLKAVDNTVKLSVKFNLDLANELKINGDNDISCKVYDINEDCIFTGYVRKSYSFEKTQINKPISIEIISPSYFLDKEIKNEIFKTNATVSNIIADLGSQAGLNLSCSITDIVTYFRAEEGDNIKNTVQQLLFEFGYSYDFDTDGAFITYPLFNEPGTNLFIFNNSNIQTQLKMDRSEKEYSGVTAKWDEKEFVRDQILYEDTEGGGTAGSCRIEIEPASYMYGSDNQDGKHYLNYDCTKGEVLYCSSIHPELKGENLSNVQTSYTNKYTSVLWSAFNSSFNLSAYYTKFQFKGDAWVKKSTNETKTTVNTDDKSLEITLKYLNTSDAVSSLIEKIANYYRKSLFKVSFNSNADVDLGSFVKITDESMGTITGRIIQKQKTTKKTIYYVVESVSDYIPAEAVETKSNIKKPASDGTSEAFQDFSTLAASLQKQIDDIDYNGTTCALDMASVAINIDDQGITQSVQTFTTQVILQRSENRLDWQLGNIELPYGFTYVKDGNYLTFTVGEGISITAGFIKIPVIYKPIINSDYYIDEDGNYYVDEAGDRYVDIEYGTTGTTWDLYLNYVGTGIGKFLFTFTTISQITSCNPNVSDYFVWGGINRTTSALAYEGFLRQGQTYKYIGTGKTWQWEIDTNPIHMQGALSDVLAIANADLENNNSVVWAYLDHLTSNSVYTGMLVSKEGFIDQLVSKLIEADIVTVGQLESAQIDLSAYNFASTSDIPGANYIVKSTRELYFKTTSKTAPSKPTSSSIINETDITDAWTSYAVGLSQNYYIYACTEETYYDDSESNPHKTYTDVYVHTKTIISNGYIRTGLIKADEVKALEGIFDNITVTGTVNAYAGRFEAGLGFLHNDIDVSFDSGAYSFGLTMDYKISGSASLFIITADRSNGAKNEIIIAMFLNCYQINNLYEYQPVVLKQSNDVLLIEDNGIVLKGVQGDFRPNITKIHITELKIR